MDLSNVTLTDYLKNETVYQEAIKNLENFNKIPLLNYANLQNCIDGTLVRFRGMIQDMIDPEIYMEKYVMKKCEQIANDESNERIQDGRFRDVIVAMPNETIYLESPLNVHGERRPIFLVSIPGLNTWAEDIERNKYTLPVVKNCISSEVTNNCDELSKKRSAEAMDTDDTDANVSISRQKKSDTTTSEIVEKSQIISDEYLLNSPLPSRPSRACIIKIYEDFDELKLNSIIDVAGFLSLDPSLDGSTCDSNEFDDLSAIQATNPPPSLIPRLHAVHIQHLKHFNPLLEYKDNVLLSSQPPANQMNKEDFYKNLLLALTQCLFGDAIAAEYLMCHLISSVYKQTDMETYGQFTLNISNIPAEYVNSYTDDLYRILESLLPASHLLPLTLENLNTLQFAPKKDYETNKLTSSVLQLAAHTHLVLDETKLQPGKLEQPGVEAVSVIANLINQQKLRCNFQFYNLEYQMNIAVLCISEGRSMLPSNCQIPLKPEPDCVNLITETFKAVAHFLQSNINSYRWYINQLKLQDFIMEPAVMELIQNDFVEMRQQCPKTSVDDLHGLLVLSRLLGLCRGRSALDTEMWQRAKDLEKERKKRLIK